MRSDVKLDAEKTKEVYGYDVSELADKSTRKVVVECLACHRLIHREYRNVHQRHQCPVVVGDKKRCFKCGDWKDVSLFSKCRSLSGGVAKMCRECYNKHPSVQTLEKRRRERLREALSKGDIEFYLKRRSGMIKSNAKKKGIIYDLDAEYLIDLWRKQNGLCYYTDMSMTGSMWQEGFQAWDAPSLDRKNPGKGYVKGNVVWCMFAVNSFKQSLNEDRFLELVKLIRWRAT